MAISNAEDLKRVMETGLQQRAVGSSSIHDQSSRSHAVLRLEIVNQDLVEARKAVLEADARVHPIGRIRDDIQKEFFSLVKICKDEQGRSKMIAKCDDENSHLSTKEWFQWHESLVTKFLDVHDNFKEMNNALARALDHEMMICNSGPRCLRGTVTLVDLAG